MPSIQTIKGLEIALSEAKDKIEASLPENLRHDYMTFRNALVAKAKKEPKILSCDASSVLGTFITCVTLGLPPDTPLQYAHLIPYKGELTLQIGYRGWLELMFRSKEVVSVHAETLHSVDKYDIEEGDNWHIKHKKSMTEERTRENLEGAYAIATLRDGKKAYNVMTKLDIENVIATSVQMNDGRFTSPAWRNHFLEMVKKFPIKRLSKYMKLNKEIALAYQVDSDDNQKVAKVDIKAKKYDIDAIEVDDTDKPTKDEEKKQKNQKVVDKVKAKTTEKVDNMAVSTDDVDIAKKVENWNPGTGQ